MKSFFKYQKKSIFSIPIATTPAADPMINILPPVSSRKKAIKCHNGSSVTCENIPIDAATSGTLSMTAEPIPNSIITISVFGIAVFKPSAKLETTFPRTLRLQRLIKIPKKEKGILGKLNLRKRFCVLGLWWGCFRP